MRLIDLDWLDLPLLAAAKARAFVAHVQSLFMPWNIPGLLSGFTDDCVVRFGDLPTDQAWHVQNLITSLLIQTTTDGEEGRQAFNVAEKSKWKCIGND